MTILIKVVKGKEGSSELFEAPLDATGFGHQKNGEGLGGRMIHRNVIAKFSARNQVVAGTSDWIFPGTRPYAKSAQQIKIAAAFMRGGTSKAIVFHRRDLPAVAVWDEVFLAVCGSPF